MNNIDEMKVGRKLSSQLCCFHQLRMQKASSSHPDEVKQVFFPRLVIYLKGLLLLAILIAAFSPSSFAAETLSKASDGHYEFEQLNFKFKELPSPWKRLNPKAINPKASLAFVRSSPHAMLQVTATKVEQVNISVDNLAAYIRSQLKVRNTSNQPHSETHYALDGIEGVQFASTQVVGQRKLNYVMWSTVKNGISYDLTMRADTASMPLDSLLRESKVVFSHFYSLVPNGSLPAPKLVFESELFDYKVDIKAPGWIDWSAFERLLPEAEFAALYPAQEGGLIVIPVYLEDKNPSMPSLASGLLGRMHVDYRTQPFIRKSKIKQDGMDGIELDFQRAVNGKDFVYRARILRGAKSAFLIASWGVGTQHDAQKEVFGSLSSFHFNKEATLADKLIDVSSRQNTRQALVLNGIGLYYFANRQYLMANGYFKTAFVANPDDRDMFTNTLQTFGYLKRYQEGLVFIEQSSTQFSNNPDVLALRAFFNNQLGRTEEAITDYLQVFALGHRNDNDFSDFINLLWRAGREDEAFKRTIDYVERTKSRQVQRLVADLHSRRGEHEKSLEILKSMRSESDFDLALLYELIEAYAKSSKHQEAIDLCDELIMSGNDSASLHFMKGRSEYALTWYKQAKVSFEASLKLNPADNQVRDYLTHVSALIGEGSNSNIKEPIEPVLLPKFLIDTPPVDGIVNTAQTYGAYYLLHAKVIQYSKDKELKRTVYHRVKILNAKGAERFGVFDFPFDPLSERVYVNSLVIRDKAGKVITTGDTADYYVMDAADDDIADDQKILHIPVPGLGPGKTLELTVTYQLQRPPEDFKFVEYNFSHSIPVEQSALVLKGDIDELNYRVADGVQEIRDHESISWIMKEPAVYHWESMQQDYRNFLPMAVVASKTVNWQTIARKYLDMIADRMQASSIVSKVKKDILNGIKDKEAVVNVLSDYVQNQLSYRAIEFGRRALIPNPIEKILRNRYGDCKDHALLLYHLLQDAGINAQLALVNSEKTVWKDFASLDQFNHMIVYCETCGENKFLDPTNKDMHLMSYPPLALAGKTALILDADRSRLVDIPEYRPEDNQFISNRVVRLMRSGDVIINEKLVMKGYMAASFRGAIKSTPASERTILLQKQISGINQRVLVKHLDISNLESVRKDLILDIEYRLNDQFLYSNGELLGKVPFLWESYFLGTEPIINRVTPFKVSYPLSFDSHISFEMPKEYFVAKENEHKEKSKQENFFVWNGVIKPTEDNLNISFNIRRFQGRHLPQRYNNYQDEVNNIFQFLGSPLAFRKTDP